MNQKCLFCMGGCNTCKIALWTVRNFLQTTNRKYLEFLRGQKGPNNQDLAEFFEGYLTQGLEVIAELEEDYHPQEMKAEVSELFGNLAMFSIVIATQLNAQRATLNMRHFRMQFIGTPNSPEIREKVNDLGKAGNEFYSASLTALRSVGVVLAEAVRGQASCLQDLERGVITEPQELAMIAASLKQLADMERARTLQEMVKYLYPL